jgi:hypothetical protein
LKSIPSDPQFQRKNRTIRRSDGTLKDRLCVALKDLLRFEKGIASAAKQVPLGMCRRIVRYFLKNPVGHARQHRLCRSGAELRRSGKGDLLATMGMKACDKGR